MGHHIEAIITSEVPNEEKLHTLDIPIFVENGYYIIPLEVSHATYWGKQWNVYDDYGDHFGGINPMCLRSIERIAIEIQIHNFALIATDYHGGGGDQAAKVYHDNKEIEISGRKVDNSWGLKGVDINSALQAIGVIKTKENDEFDTINLSNYRNFQPIFEKYEEYDERE